MVLSVWPASQSDYILLKQRFQSGINIAKMWSFPGADIGSHHDLVMMNFRLRLKKIVKPKQVRMKFALEKLKDPKITEAFHAMIGGKFAPLTILEEENTDTETLTNKFNNTANVTLGKCHKKKPWVTIELLDMCDKRKGVRTAPEELININQQRNQNRHERSQRKMEQCSEIEDNLNKNNSKRAFQE